MLSKQSIIGHLHSLDLTNSEENLRGLGRPNAYHFLLEIGEVRPAAAVQQDLHRAQLLVNDRGLRAVQEAETRHHMLQH